MAIFDDAGLLRKAHKGVGGHVVGLSLPRDDKSLERLLTCWRNRVDIDGGRARERRLEVLVVGLQRRLLVDGGG